MLWLLLSPHTFTPTCELVIITGTMNHLRTVYELVRETAVDFGRDKGPLLAAALAYHTIFSLAPLLVIVVAVAGFVLGEQAVAGELVHLIEGAVGREAAVIIQNLISSASQGRTGVWATIFSTALLFLGASNIFGQLKTALNMIWGIAQGPDPGLLALIKTRFMAIFMVMGIGFLLLTAVATNTILTTITRRLAAQGADVRAALPGINYLITFAVLTLLFAIIYKTLPDARVAWRDALVGGGVTSLLFGVGQFFMGLYLSSSSIGSAYGAASSLVVILFWIYISAQILMFGAEFTKVYANKHGAKLQVPEKAVLLQKNIYTRSNPVLPLAPEPPVEPVALVPGSVRPFWRRQVATALLALAFGLFLGFLGNQMRRTT